MSQPRVAIAITADDKTAKGVNSAEKRVGGLTGRVSGIARAGKSMSSTFGRVEESAARLFGGRSLSSAFNGKLGLALETAAKLRMGMTGAAEAGAGLEARLAGVGAAAAGTAAVVGAAAVAMVKLSDSWGKGANNLGNMASLMGVSVKGLQQFTGAAERVGVSKETATGAMGSLSQTLNDAAFHKNVAAQVMLKRIGVRMQKHGDGTADVEAMLPSIANGLTRLNSSGRRTAAAALGIPLEALPAFTQGARPLQRDMEDYGRNGAMLTDADTDLGRRITHRDTAATQRVGGITNQLQRLNATVVEGTGDAAKSAARAVGDAATTTAQAVTQAVRTGSTAGSSVIDRARRGNAISHPSGVHGAGRFSASQIDRLARKALPLIAEGRAAGFGLDDAVGVASSVVLESGGQTHAQERGGSKAGRGLLQITDRARKRLFRKVEGVDIDRASREQQWHFAHWETEHSEAANWRKAHARGGGAEDVAAGYARYVIRPADKDRDSAERAAVAQALTIHLQVQGLPQGTRVTAAGTTAQGPPPAISHAMVP